MADVFTAATEVAFASPDFGADATFAPTAGAPQAVRVLILPRDPALVLGDQAVRHPGWQADLNRAEVSARPGEGDTLTVTGGPWAGTYTVRSVETRATCWRCHVDEAA